MRTLALVLALSVPVTACTTDAVDSRQVADRLAHSDELARIVANAEQITTLTAAGADRAQIDALAAANDALAAQARSTMPDLACLADPDGKAQLGAAVATRHVPFRVNPCTDRCQSTLTTELGFCLVLSETGILFLLCAAAATATDLSCIASCNSGGQP